MKSIDVLFGILVSAILTIGGYMAHGCALAILWNWLCVPLGASHLTLVHGCMLWFVYQQLAGPVPEPELPTFKKEIGFQLMIRFGKPAWAVFVGWVIQFFM